MDDSIHSPQSKIDEVLTRGVANVISGKEGLRKRLESGRKLNIYYGIDPTATRIHVGHAVGLRKLQAFLELGHNITFLIGDFTALIGDTSDKDTERPVLTTDEINANFQSYKKQAEKVLDFSKVRIVHNSEWLSKLSFEDIVKLCQHFPVGDFVGRELIRKRLDANKRVGLHELLYPVMQGYDSYHLDTDLQLGGTDQTFNMQAGRVLQKDLRGKESFVLTTEFLIGTDGRKMSKSWGNAIWLEDSPENMYTKVMAILDDVIAEYFILATNVSMEKVQEVKERLQNRENPRDLKKELARELVTELHSCEEATKAQEYFEKTVVNKEMPTEIPVVTVGQSENLFELSDLLVKVGLAGSKSEAKRLVEQGGVMIDEERQENPSKEVAIEDSIVVKVGKRKFVEVRKV